MVSLKNLCNFPAGVIFGGIIAFSICWTFDSDIQDDTTKLFTILISGTVTIGAAAVALSGVLSSIENQNRQEQARRSAELSAAGAVLSLTLSTLHRLAEQGFETAMRTESLRKGPDEDVTAALRALDVPSDQINRLQKCIQHSDSHTRAWLSLIVAHWQLETARLESNLLDKNLLISDQQIKDSAAQWLLIQAFISQLFEFSRTGIEPGGELNKQSFGVPLFSPYYSSDHELHCAVRSYGKYFDETGGWTATAFRERLKNPTLDPA